MKSNIQELSAQEVLDNAVIKLCSSVDYMTEITKQLIDTGNYTSKDFYNHILRLLLSGEIDTAVVVGSYNHWVTAYKKFSPIYDNDIEDETFIKDLKHRLGFKSVMEMISFVALCYKNLCSVDDDYFVIYDNCFKSMNKNKIIEFIGSNTSYILGIANRNYGKVMDIYRRGVRYVC